MTVTGLYAKCCDQYLVSRHRHDWRSCKCGKVYIDGGQTDYTRIGGERENWELVEIKELTA